MPNRPFRLLITGASGSGTTTLGKTFATRVGWEHYDTDDYYWLRTTPPYQVKRVPIERAKLLTDDLSRAHRSVLSGSLDGWSQEIESSFNLIVFLYVAADIRVQRLRLREIEEVGHADPEILKWASEYDTGPKIGGRSLEKQTDWLSKRTCPIGKINGDVSVEDRCLSLRSAVDDQIPGFATAYDQGS